MILSKLLILLLLAVLSRGYAQAPHCNFQAREPQTEAEAEQQRQSQYYRELLAGYHSLLPSEPDTALRMPVAGVRVTQVADTWGAPRGAGRLHEGQDIFAPRGTAIYSATPGYVYRINTTPVGGLVVWIAGAGGRRYYYAHLHTWGDIYEGQWVDTNTVIGYVGNTGNAITTPPHLHFGIYSGSSRTCDRMVYDPLPLLVNRD